MFPPNSRLFRSASRLSLPHSAHTTHGAHILLERQRHRTSANGTRGMHLAGCAVALPPPLSAPTPLPTVPIRPPCPLLYLEQHAFARLLSSLARTMPHHRLVHLSTSRCTTHNPQKPFQWPATFAHHFFALLRLGVRDVNKQNALAAAAEGLACWACKPLWLGRTPLKACRCTSASRLTRF